MHIIHNIMVNEHLFQYDL